MSDGRPLTGDRPEGARSGSEPTSAASRPAGPTEPTEPTGTSSGTRPNARASPAASAASDLSRVGAVDSIPPRRAMLPPPPAAKAQVWGALLLGLALLAPPLAIGFGRADTTAASEQAALASSRSTWQAQADRGGATWLVPRWNGEPAVGQPPLVVWLNLLAWAPLDAATASTESMVARARLVAMGFSLLALASTFWAGMSVGGIRIALMSMLIAGTFALFPWAGSRASPEVYLAGLCTLAVAAGLWAMRPLKVSSGLDRRVVGWLIAGLSLGAAMLLVRPATAASLVVIPLALMILIVPRRRLGNTLGLVFAMAVGALAIAPWVIYVTQQASRLGLERPLAAIFGASGPAAAPIGGPGLVDDRGGRWDAWAAGWLALWLAPWVFWLVGGLCQPWLRGEGDRRRQLLIVWLWFIALLPALWLAGARPHEMLLPILPAAGLVAAQLWAYHIRLADRSVLDPGTNRLRLPHWAAMLAASAAIPLYLLFQDHVADLVDRWSGGDDRLALGADAWPALHAAVVIVVGSALLGVAVGGLIWHYRWKPRWAFAATAAWAIVLLTMLRYSHVRSDRGVNPYRADAARVAATVDRAPLYRLKPAGSGNPPLSPAFLFYSGRSVHATTADRLDEAQPPHEPLYVICAASPAQARALTAQGFEHLFDFQDGRTPLRQLFHRPPRSD